MKNKLNYSFLFILLLQTILLFGQSLTPNTTGSFVYTPTGPLSSKPITVYYHIPAGNISTMPILFAFHGDERDGANYRNYWISMANANGFMVFAPEYSEANYPGGDRYQLGNVFENGDSPSVGTYNAQNLWTFSTVDPLFDDIKVRVSGTQSSYDAWGHSGGAQFLQRFRMYLPNSKLNTAICSNAGWYTVPEISIDFPYGINKSQLTNPNLITAFSKRLIVHLGLNDTDPNSPGLRHNTIVDNQQGFVRLERGRYFFNKSLAYSQALSNTFNWQREEVAGVGHDPQLMANNALRFLFQPNNNTVSYSVLDGGFENQTVTTAIPAGSTATPFLANLSTTLWTTNTTSGNTSSIIATGGRTGPKFARFGPSGTGNARVYYSPQLPTGVIAPSSTYQIQFYYKTASTVALQASSVNLHVNNTSLTQAQSSTQPQLITPVESVVAGFATTTTASGWTGVSVSLTTNATAAGLNGLASITLDAVASGTYTADIDDFVIYQASSADTTAPDSPGAITATGAANGQANLSWGGASGGVDGGGYVVVRFASTTPAATDDPILNGIYSFNNAIGAGVVRYTGTGTSFTDNGLSPGTNYYYKVYTVDKAFNYSAESVMASPVQALATTFYYKGTGVLTTLSNWGINTDGTGTAPLNFTDTSQVFEIRNTTAVSLDGTWTVGGASANGTIVRLGNNSLAAITLTLNSGASIGPGGTGNVDVVAPSSGAQTVVYKNTTSLSFGIISDPNFVVIYDGVTVSSATTRSFGTVSLINGANVTFSANLSIDNLNVNSLSTITFDNNRPTITNTIVNGTLVAPTNNSSFITIPSDGTLTVNGTIRIPRLSGFVSSGLGAPNTSTTTGANIQFLGIENLTLGANSIVEYIRDAGGDQAVTARADYKNVTFSGTAPKKIIGTTTVTGTLIINSPATVSVTAPNLTVTGAIANSGTMTLANDSNLIQGGTTNTNTGNITVNRSSNPLSRLDYKIWSSPVAAQDLLLFSPATLPTRFYNYNETTNLYSSVPSPSGTPFATAAGYLIRMPDNAPIAPGLTSFAGVFTGVPNNGDITKVVTYNGALFGYNMLGNPYPSTLDANAFIAANTANIESSLYFWRKINGAGGTAYAVYNPLGGTTASASSAVPNGTIQIGQGFFVKAKSASNVIFTNAMRLGTVSTQFFKTKQVQKDRLWLNLTSTSGAFSQALVGYTADATSGVDMYDAKYFNDSPIALTSNIDNEEYTIQGRPTFDTADVVVIYFKTGIAGDYNIALSQFDGVFSTGQDIYLLDSKTGIETDLKAGSYTFTATAGTDNSRFSLKYQKTLKTNEAAFNENSVSVYKNNGLLYVNSGSLAISTISVYDVQGRLLSEHRNVKATTATIKDVSAMNQVLIVKIVGEDNAEVTKKVVN